jgi:AcrR family transcriptional regulator
MAESAVDAGLRARKKERTHDAIVAAAIDLFETKGFESTTIEEIAAAADVSPRTFFRYFDSKVDVAMGPKHEHEDDDFADRLAARPTDEPLVESVCQVLKAELDGIANEDPLFTRQVRVILKTPSLRALAREHFGEHEADMAAAFAERFGQRVDDLRPQVMASAIGNAIWTIVTRWAEEDAPPERLLEMLDETQAILVAGFQ